MDIVEEIRKDRESGAKRLVSEYKAGLLTLARRFCDDASDAEELVNRTFAEVVANIERYAEQSAFFGWMCQILSNLHANDCRRKATANTVYPGTVPDVADHVDHDSIFGNLDHEFLREAIEQLPQDIRKAVVLHYFMEMPVREVARVLSTPTGTIAWRLHCAREILSAKLTTTARKPGGKALLFALALMALTAAGAAGLAISGALHLNGPAGPSGASRLSLERLETLDSLADDDPTTRPLDHQTTGQTDERTNESTTLRINGQTDQRLDGSAVQRTNDATTQRSNDLTEKELTMTKTTRTSVLAAAALLGASATALGADFYVATTGDDGTGDGSQALPFATIGAAITAANTAISGGDTSATIHVADGTYTENSLTLANPITIVGESGDRDAVIIDANKAGRTFTLNHAAATLSGITVRNGKTPSNNTDFGGNILIGAAGGIVTNCIVLGGIANNGGNIGIVESDAALVIDSIVSGGDANRGEIGNGGNIYAKGGRVSRCVISGGISRAAFSNGNYGGANIHMARWDSHTTVVENCLVTGGELTSQGHGSGIHVAQYATARIVNCTIAKNLPGSNNRAAVYLKSTSAKVVNCAIYDNGGTAATEWGNANAASFYSCATASGAAISGGTDNIATLTDASFKDYANGDYHPATGLVLVDAGCNPSSYASGCATDLDGVARPSGDAWDIGCYEFDWSAVSVDVTFTASAEKAFIGESVTFTPQVFGSAGPFTFKWNFDDGAGDEASSAATMTHTFATVGLHYPTVSVSTDGGSTWAASYTATSPIKTAPEVMWVDVSSASPAYPYATEATAAANLSDALNVLTNAAGALAMDGVTIKVKPGTYTGAGYPELSVAVTILGVGDRDSVIFDANQAGRALALNHASATLSGITVRNGKIPNSSTDFGGNILIGAAGGIVTNCVITGGIANNGGNISMESDEALVIDSTVSGGDANYGERGNGGNIYLKGGRVSRCVISSGISRAGFGTGNYGGANIHVARWDSHTAVVENCLATGGEFTSRGQGSGIHVAQYAAARIVNCTIVKNLPGSNNRAAVYLNSTGASAVNCAIYGNGGTAATEWGNANAAGFYSCAFAAEADFTGANSTVKDLTAAAFKNYARGDYTPKSGGPLMNAGDDALYSTYGATSATDLAGKPRVAKNVIDIGCYENNASPATVVLMR